MGFKKFIVGEPMPDKNDPKFRERYEREVEAGRKFADASGISWLARKIHGGASNHKVLFLVVVFGIVLLCFAYNIFTMIKVYNRSNSKGSNAVEQVDRALQSHRSDSPVKEYSYE